MNNIENLIARWITWSNERSMQNALPGEPDLDLDRGYIYDTKLITEFLPATHDADTVYLIRCYVQDELNSFDILAVYNRFSTLVALLTEVDTTWYTIYTNAEDDSCLSCTEKGI